MGWTTPLTAVASTTFTAAQFNTYVRDNLNYLFARPYDYHNVDESADYTTTSTSFGNVDGTDLSLDLTCAGTLVLVWFSGVVDFSATNQSVYFDVALDGVRVAGGDGITLARSDASEANAYETVCFAMLVPVTAGAVNLKLQWKVSAGTGTLLAGAGGSLDVHPQFGAVEVSNA